MQIGAMCKGLIELFCIVGLCVGPAQSGTLEDVVSGGVLQCGVDLDVEGFSKRDASGQWVGTHVDVCRAVAAAVIGDPLKVVVTGLNPDERVEALQSGEIDVLVSTLALTPENELLHGMLAIEPLTLRTQGNSVEAFAPHVRQGDDQWFVVLKWVRHILVFVAQSKAAGKDATAALSRLDEMQVAGLRPGWASRTATVDVKISSSSNVKDQFWLPLQ